MMSAFKAVLVTAIMHSQVYPSSLHSPTHVVSIHSELLREGTVLGCGTRSKLRAKPIVLALGDPL